MSPTSPGRQLLQLRLQPLAQAVLHQGAEIIDEIVVGAPDGAHPIALATLALLATGGAVIGFLLSMLGAGGSILLLPLLVSGASLPIKEAVPLPLRPCLWCRPRVRGDGGLAPGCWCSAAASC